MYQERERRRSGLQAAAGVYAGSSLVALRLALTLLVGRVSMTGVALGQVRRTTSYSSCSGTRGAVAVWLGSLVAMSYSQMEPGACIVPV